MIDAGLPDVPEISVDWYHDIVDFAADTPQPVQWFAEHFTEGAILLLGALWLVSAVSRLGGGPRDRAYALVSPAPVVLAYGCSELLKTVLDQERPCRALATELAIIAGECPPAGDWSFPSNHSTIAGGLAVATLLLSRRVGLVALPLAALAAFSRTFVGVHYPHDVFAGVLLGALLAALLTPLLARPAAGLLHRRARRAERPVHDPAAPTSRR
ncbi:phosphatase PAP2 family protein [Micromonospora sp. C31]|uniref:phosphatase PAP2 family protein n=1 Tax=Micromonospora sp. C31 TaxID=2824876 RepID=UPI001B381908|nr:phosphatase PAP2 family protein [Micromonospora sp. C31]MBQ1076094.1 phosphatase PAP2 family protein [Micromonospora sp. C31]